MGDQKDAADNGVSAADEADKAVKAEKHPMLAANLFSRISYSWVYPLLAHGAKNRLTEKDLYSVCPDDEAKGLCSALETQWAKEKTRSSPSFMRAILMAVALPLWPYLIAGITQSACKVGQTQFLAALLRFFADTDAPISEGLIPAIGICVTGLFIAVLHHIFFFVSWRCGMQMRIAATTFLYRHATTMRMDSLDAHSGQVINVISNDIERLQLLGSFISFLIVGPLESIAVLVLLWVQVRPPRARTEAHTPPLTLLHSCRCGRPRWRAWPASSCWCRCKPSSPAASAPCARAPPSSPTSASGCATRSWAASAWSR